MNEQVEGVRSLNQVVQIDEGRIQAHLDEVVRNTVEETLNALLDAEADRLCGAQRYERNEERRDTRAGAYHRRLQTKAGEASLKVPKLRNLPFETAIIERYKRRESSVEEALVEMYLAGASVRRVEDITEALWGTRVSAVALTDSHQARKMELHSGFDFARRNVVTARFQTLGQLFGMAQHTHRLAANVHLLEQRFALTGLHTVDLGDDRRNRARLGGSRYATRLHRRWCCRAR